MKDTFVKANQAGALLIVLLLSGCGGGSNNGDVATSASAGAGAASKVSTDEALASAVPTAKSSATALLKTAPPAPKEAHVAVGESLFKDTNLSASKQMACASCHAESAGHADKLGTFLPLGGPQLTTAGMRSSPTVRYLNENVAFRFEKDGVPYGGFTWDGRTDSRKEQAAAPFFEHVEMALPGSPSEPSALTDLVRSAAYYPDLTKLYAPDQLDTDLKLFDKITELIEIYQRDDQDYNLFDSRFDRSLTGQAVLNAPEVRGLAIFKDKDRGNCISCHTMDKKKPIFTDFGYAAIGAPRNHAGPKNSDPDYFDMGLCMRERAKTPTKKYAAQDARYCGMFKTPTLRNVERTAPYFHNASVATLEAAVRFHYERDSQPAKWYRGKDGSVDRVYNDLPLAYQRNLARGKPFDGSYSPTDAEVADLLAFLRTLTDADQVDPAQ